MKKFAFLIFLGCLASCADKTPDKPVTEPAKPKKNVTATRQAPAPPVDPAAGFRTLEGDRNLPTKKQLAEGQAPPVGTVVAPDTPSAAVKPPVNETSATPADPSAPVAPAE